MDTWLIKIKLKILSISAVNLALQDVLRHCPTSSSCVLGDGLQPSLIARVWMVEDTDIFKKGVTGNESGRVHNFLPQHRRVNICAF
jgi:hypothetical protein